MCRPLFEPPPGPPLRLPQHALAVERAALAARPGRDPATPRAPRRGQRRGLRRGGR
jgi:hypothetical protein